MLSLSSIFFRTPFAEVNSTVPSCEEDQTVAKLEAQQRIYERIRSFQGQLDFENVDIFISKQAQSVIHSLLQPIPHERLVAHNLLTHEWMLSSMSD